MLNLLILVIIRVVVFTSLSMHIENRSTEVDYVVSGYDQQKYVVRNLPDKEHAAHLLSLIKTQLIKLVEHLTRTYPKDPRVKRLQENFDPDRISEASPTGTYTSYSVNKGEKIVFCLRQRDQHENLLDLNTMIFVAIHEIAHIMTESVGHTPEFWENMKFVLNVAMSNDLQIYQYHPYHERPQSYCGTVISDTPLKIKS